MNERQNSRWCFIAFPVAGLLSALLPVCFNLHRLVGDSGSYILIGGTFGACNAACLYWFFGMRSLWRILAFVAGSVAADYTSLLAAAGAFWALRSPAFSMHEAMAFFVGGFTGAFIVLLAALLLFSPAMNFLSLLLLVCGALVGGVLGVVGRAAGQLFLCNPNAASVHEILWRRLRCINGYPLADRHGLRAFPPPVDRIKIGSQVGPAWKLPWPGLT